jgi:RimJ/RimL family protein N-acetyltransferase
VAVELRLRPFCEDDLPALFAHQLEPEATAMAGFPSRDAEAFAAHWARLGSDPTVETAVVEVDGVVAGNVGSWVEDGRRLLGYWIGREFWGRGVATEAVRAFVASTRDRPLHALVATHNAASMRVLEKCGFVAVSRDDDEVLYELS